MTATVRSPDDSVTEFKPVAGVHRLSLISLILSVHSTFSARFEGHTEPIMSNRKYIATVSFIPRQERRYEAFL